MHDVSGIIGSPQALGVFAKSKSLRPPVAMSAGVAMIPLRDEDLDSFLPLPLTGSTEGFDYLSDQLLGVLGALSAEGRVMYFETRYFGGTGTQGAVVLENRNVIYGPRVTETVGPINAALALLGVSVQPPAFDEFDTIGLGTRRSTDRWLGIE